jgi:N-acetylglucosamine kinase-like BadF-type ATPase
MPLASLSLGIDGGGTTTTACVSDDSGQVVGRGTAGASNPVKVGLSASKRAILAAARPALAAIPHGELRAVCLGLAGADRREIRQPILTWLRKAIPAQTHLLTTDAAIALEAALGRRPGVIVIAGTGSIACGRDTAGHVARAGGWGSVFGDEGSAYAVGRSAISAALRARDGLTPPTRLEQDISSSLGLVEIQRVAGLKLTHQQVAALAPLVLAASRKGDRAAVQIVNEAARELARLATALIRRLKLGGQPVRVVLAGGLLLSNGTLRSNLRRRLKTLAPQAAVSVLRREPVQGAIELARRSNPSDSI